MTEIKSTTQRGQQMCRAYKWSNKYNIHSAYDRPSLRKINAWEYCKKLCEENNGYGLKITGHNTCTFSAGFLFNKDGSTYLCYITPSYDYVVLYE